MNTINNPFICVFLPFALAAYEAYIAAGVVITGVGYLVYKLTSGSSSHIHSKLKHIKNKVKVPRKIKNPNSSVRYHINKGKKGNRHKLHVVSKVTRSISTVKYYSSNNKRSNSNLKLSKSKVAQIVYQDAYDTYLSTKNRERAKLDKPTNVTSYNHFLHDVKAYEKGSYKFLQGPKGPDDDFYDGAKIVKALYKDANKNLNYGKFLMKNGKRSKGLYYISFASFEFSLIPAIIYNQLSLRI